MSASTFNSDTARDVWIAVCLSIAAIAVFSAIAWWARVQIVEPEAVAAACLSGQGGWQCALREQLVLGFTRNAFGIAAVIVGVLATVSRWRSVALLAIACGVTGAILYRYELSGVGVLLGALVLLRRPPQEARQQDAGGEQPTQATPQ
jgi:hypothetical protein